MPGRSSRAFAVAAGILVTLVIMAAVALRMVARDRASERPPAATDAPESPDRLAAAGKPANGSKPLFSSSDEPPPDPQPGGAPREENPHLDPLQNPEYPAGSWEGVDLEQVREALPDNLYWQMASPTKDPEILSQRREERDRWNLEYGKVLSNTATAEEIERYYAHRQKLSQDYLTFVVYVLENYGYQIPARDVALLKLAAEMHNARLEQLPREIAEAHQRREAHDAARRAWLEEQRAFEGDPPASD